MDYDDDYNFPDATENIFFENVRDDDAIAFGTKPTPKRGKKACSMNPNRQNSVSACIPQISELALPPIVP